MTEKNIFNNTDLLELVMGDVEAAAEILDEFYKDIPVQIEILIEALKNDDQVLSHRQAHTIKGASATIGAGCLGETARQIEVCADEGDLQQASRFLPNLVEDYSTLITAVRAAGYDISSAA